MTDRLFETRGELKKALQVDLKDIEKMQRRGEDTAGISQVIQHKKKMLKFDSWK